MEGDEIQPLRNKFPRSTNSNGRIDSNRTVFGDEEGEDGEIRRQSNTGGGLTECSGATLDFTNAAGGVGSLCGWPFSRIVRVSRASGGKDRHSKVLTSKGLRDRRVRLSVNTAIQFYDLQDRLSYDQPSKAVEWLLKAAKSSISELPPISTPFPDTPKQQSDGKRSSDGGTEVEHGFDSAEAEIEGGGREDLDKDNTYQAQQQGMISKSACSSTSETSKGSGGGLSLSRSKSRLKARERARERAAKEKKEKETENTFVVHHQNQNHHQIVSSIPQNATFTQLLTSDFAGTNNVVNQHSNTNTPNNGSGSGGVNESKFFQKSQRNWSARAMDYFGGTGMLVPSATATRSIHGFTVQNQLGNSMQQALATHVSSPFFTDSGDTHQELHSFSLIPEHFVPVVTTTGGNNNHTNEYNLNFSISSTNSSSLAGFNRGTLQSNSSTPSLLPQLQRFSSADNGSSPSPFFLSTALQLPDAAVENHHQQEHPNNFLPNGFDAGLQLFYGDGSRHADQKGKGKSYVFVEKLGSPRSIFN